MNAYIYPGLHPYSQLAISKKINKDTEPIIVGKNKAVTYEDIIEVTSTVTGIRILDMISKSRKEPITYARYCAMSIIRAKTKMSLKAIGKIFNRDHATVIHGLDMATDLIKFNQEFRENYKSILFLL